MKTRDKEFSSPADFLKRISLVYYALIFGQLLFIAITYFMVLPTRTPDNRFLTTLLVVALFVSIGGFLIGRSLFNRKITSRVRARLKEKLKNYFGAFIVRMAFLEGASIFGIIAVIITGNYYFFVFTILLILVQLSLKPSVDKISSDLKLDFEDKSKLSNRNQVL